ncbi:MAG: hypothetical protein ACERKN_07265 [Velocimicrobium sp.]
MRQGKMIMVTTFCGVERMTSGVEFHASRTSNKEILYRINGRCTGTIFEIDYGQDRILMWNKFLKLQEQLIEQELSSNMLL